MFEKMADRLYLGAGMYVEGNREVSVENCRRIEECSEIFMRLVSGCLCIQIWGSGLRAFDYTGGGLVIRGQIERIELSERSVRKNEGSDKRLRQDKG